MLVHSPFLHHHHHLAAPARSQLLSSSLLVPLSSPEGCGSTQQGGRVTRGGTQESGRPTRCIMKMSDDLCHRSFSSFPCFPPPPLTPFFPTPMFPSDDDYATRMTTMMQQRHSNDSNNGATRIVTKVQPGWPQRCNEDCDATTAQ